MQLSQIPCYLAQLGVFHYPLLICIYPVIMYIYLTCIRNAGARSVFLIYNNMVPAVFRIRLSKL